ncbi:synemin [Brienomyrus brachyistius]|uniref:synemin n=1 Tax=Brienomyrus brachyistius TaxID=42636 RepID=UPI0020B3F72D|nr:synemin [Brienomyrus brachyistius]
MFHFRRTFEEETTQLQELNKRLIQYLSRVKQLEQENAFLISEINAVRRETTSKWENQHMAELRELRRTLDRLSLEKFKAEMERQKLWRELKMIQALRLQESGERNDINGELKTSEKQLQEAQKANGALESRLLQLQNECECLEDARKREIAQFRDQVHSGALPVFIQKPPDPPEISMEEFDKYARTLSETWRETFEVYCKRIADIEESLRLDEVKLENLQKEKMQYTSEVKKLNNEVKKQNQLRVHLEEQLRNMQASFPKELNQYRVIIEELEEKCRMLANAISKKLKDHQDLMQIKMGLSLEVATYRALLEGENTDEYMWTDHRAAEPFRKIDIQMPPYPYTPKGASMSRQDGRKWKPSNISFDNKYIEQTSHMKVSSGDTRIVPITFYDVGQHNSPSQKDHPRAPQASTSVVKGVLNTKENVHAQNKIIEERTAMNNKSQHSIDSVISQQAGLKVRSKLGTLATEDSKSVRVTSPSTVSKVLHVSDEKWGTTHVKVEKTNLEKESDLDTVSMTQGKSRAGDQIVGSTDNTAVTEDCLAGNKIESQVSNSGSQFAKKSTVREPYVEHRPLATEENVLESMSVEEIIEKVVKPAGLDTTVTCHVEKSEEEDGRLRTEIILQSKVEDDLDVSDESVLEEFLSKKVKNIALEDIKGTPTGSMIENLLSFGLQGEKDLKNKSVNIEIVEEPVDSQHNEEYEITETSQFNQPSSLFFAIEELTNVDERSRHSDDHFEENRAPVTPGGEYENIRSVQVTESSRDLGAALFSQDQETEYFVSTPDDISESDDVPLSLYGHYEALDDLSDERYYQDGGLINRIFKKDGHCKALPKTTYVRDEHIFPRDSFQDCIIEEEVHVSPTVQESLLEFLRKDDMDPKEYLQGTLGQLQGTISGTVKDELALFTKTDQEASGNLAVDIRKVQQAEDSGTVTIVAELNISQNLEDSGLLEEQGEDFEAKLLSALHSCNPGVQQIINSRSEVTISKENGERLDGKVAGEDQEQHLTPEEPTNQINKTEKHIKLGPSEKSFIFQMDVSDVKPAVSSGSSGEARSSQGLRVQKDNSHEVKEDIYSYVEKANPPVNQEEAPSLEGHVNEKRIATVYLESQEDN